MCFNNNLESDPARLVILSSESHRHPKLRQVSYAELSVSQPNYWSMLQAALKI